MLQAVDARLEGSRCSSASVLVILVELPLGELVAGLELAALAAQSLGHGNFDLLGSRFVRAAGLMAVWVIGLRFLWGGGRNKRMGEGGISQSFREWKDFSGACSSNEALGRIIRECNSECRMPKKGRKEGSRPLEGRRGWRATAKGGERSLKPAHGI
jgi:hypothetical protein